MKLWDQYEKGLITMEEYHRLFRASLDPNDPLDQSILEAYRVKERPFANPQTSLQMNIRADRRRDMANSIKLTGGGVKPEYDHGDE